MKPIHLLCVLLFSLILFSCGKAYRHAQFEQLTSDHRRIAILPIDSHIKLKEKERMQTSSEKLQELNLSQSLAVQQEVEFYLLGKDLNVSIMSVNTTNAKLKEAVFDLRTVHTEDFTKLAAILGVDAVISGRIETEKPMTEAMARSIDIAKSIEMNVLGTSYGRIINTSTNRGTCRLSLSDGRSGDLLWSFQDRIEMKAGSTTKCMIRRLMWKGARRFPYRR